ncbi:unnamed protein product [Caenorhabditis sp. 36 PRJEB53466]|nr:unnamed protein product [Caenorhabditis sp. 36 PRJEB53466]
MAEETNENWELQEHERTVLESMYERQVEFFRNVWNVRSPTDVRIIVRPHDSCLLDEDKKKDVSVVLIVKCSMEYPKRKPFVDLVEPHGISQEDVRKLLVHLRKKVDNLEGSVMVCELVTTINDYLTDHNPQQPVGSFHDQMLNNKARVEAEKKRKRLDTEQKELELLEEEMKQRNATELENTLNGCRPEAETRAIGNRRVVVLTNIPVKRQKPSNICHEWMGFWNNNQLLISEWTFRYSAGHLDHNLVEYEFIHVQKMKCTAGSVLVQVFVAQKIFQYEENLQDAYEVIVPRSKLLRLLAVQAMCGLRYLHESSMTHKHLTVGSVWTRDSMANYGFRFSDFGTMGPLLDLVKLFNEICTRKYVPQEEKEKESDRRRKDLFQLGTLLDGLVLALQTRGSNYSRVSTPVQGLQNSSSSSLSKFIAKCQEAKNLDQIQDEPFLKEEPPSDSEDGLFTPFGGAMHPDGRMMGENVIIRGLGKGGFGDVVLVRNKMDSTDYAIKRIPLNNVERVNRKITKEAKFFAKMNHQNLVRYYNSWAEELIPVVSEASDDDSSLGAVPIPGKEQSPKKPKLKASKSLEERMANMGGGDSLLPARLKAISKDSKGAEAKEWSFSVFQDNKRCASRMRQSKRSTPSGGLKHLSECSSEYEDEDEEVDEGSDWDEDIEEEEEEEESSSSDSDADDETGEDRPRIESTESDDVFERSITSKSAEDDDGIVFEPNPEDINSRKEEAKQLLKVVERSKSRSKGFESINRNPRILCIQMEYCDRGTLRQYIDDNHCFNKPNEVWRIFSEVLCGLKYMHEISTIIHRDIKPLNIFLTSQNGVKIGDFGLATLDVFNPKRRPFQPAADKSNSIEAVLSPPGHKNKGPEVQQTKDIGTQLYMAPELFETETTTHKLYTSKIDIFSAGVVLFEMFYRPLPPSMERVSTLNNLRNQVAIPADFGRDLQSQMAALAKKTIERMLQKNPDLRPTADDLLNDEDLPMHSKEDATFRNLCEKVVKKRESRMNAWLLEKQFQEDVPTSVNYCYDIDLCQDRLKLSNKESLVETVRYEFCQVLKVHAFEKLATHTLMPVSTALAAASVRTKPVEFLDRNGLPVALPMDLRQNFVRYCVRNSIQRFKRYNFGRVYSQSAPNVHPIEKWECCVDCIGPQSSSTSLDAELLLVACEMIAASLPGTKLILKVGHAFLLEAQIRHLNLSDDVRAELLDCFHSFSTFEKPSLKEKVEKLTPKIGSKAANIISKLPIPVESNFNSFKEKVALFRKKLKVETAKDLMDKAIKDLDEIIQIFKHCRSEELEKRISIIYDSQTCYRPRTFGDGLVFQLQVETSAKKGRGAFLLGGGRYDSALLRERHPRDFVYELPLCITGFGVQMDSVAFIKDSCSVKAAMVAKSPRVSPKVLVCSLVQESGSKLIPEKFSLAKKFWSLGVEADVFHAPVDDLESLNEHRNRASISHIIAVMSKNCEYLCKTDHHTMTMDFAEIVSTVCRETQSLTNLPPNQTPNGGPISSASTPGEANHYEEHSANTTPVLASKSASTSHITGIRPMCASQANINVCFATSSDKHHKFLKEKKRVESQVASHLADYVSQFSSKTKVEVLVCDIPADVIKKIIGEIEKTSSDQEINTLFDQLIQKHGKVDLAPISKQLHTILHGSPTGFGSGGQIVVIFYRHADNFFRCLT